MTRALPADASGRVDISALLKYLGSLDYANVLVEGGPETLASLFAAKVVDEVRIFIAPIIIGGPNARHAVGGEELTSLARAYPLRLAGFASRGPDVRLVLRRP
jgi:diaminohydroxyphosphoribosylaminopyrimidine deaminase/5-amino-6-(5-phosphoribosylamino)uracil reductase